MVRAGGAEPEFAVVVSDEGVDDGEAEAGSCATVGVISALEAFCSDGQEVGRHARPGVGDGEYDSAAGVPDGEVDWWRTVCLGIRDEVCDDLTDLRCRHRDAEPGGFAVQLNAEVLQAHSLNDVLNVDRLFGRFGCGIGDLSQIEQLFAEADEITNVCLELGQCSSVLLDAAGAPS